MNQIISQYYKFIITPLSITTINKPTASQQAPKPSPSLIPAQQQPTNLTLAQKLLNNHNKNIQQTQKIQNSNTRNRSNIADVSKAQGRILTNFNTNNNNNSSKMKMKKSVVIKLGQCTGKVICSRVVDDQYGLERQGQVDKKKEMQMSNCAYTSQQTICLSTQVLFSKINNKYCPVKGIIKIYDIVDSSESQGDNKNNSSNNQIISCIGTFQAQEILQNMQKGEKVTIMTKNIGVTVITMRMYAEKVQQQQIKQNIKQINMNNNIIKTQGTNNKINTNLNKNNNNNNNLQSSININVIDNNSLTQSIDDQAQQHSQKQQDQKMIINTSRSISIKNSKNITKKDVLFNINNHKQNMSLTQSIQVNSQNFLNLSEQDNNSINQHFIQQQQQQLTSSGRYNNSLGLRRFNTLNPGISSYINNGTNNSSNGNFSNNSINCNNNNNLSDITDLKSGINFGHVIRTAILAIPTISNNGKNANANNNTSKLQAKVLSLRKQKSKQQSIINSNNSVNVSAHATTGITSNNNHTRLLQKNSISQHMPKNNSNILSSNNSNNIQLGIYSNNNIQDKTDKNYINNNILNIQKIKKQKQIYSPMSISKNINNSSHHNATIPYNIQITKSVNLSQEQFQAQAQINNTNGINRQLPRQYNPGNININMNMNMSKYQSAHPYSPPSTAINVMRRQDNVVINNNYTSKKQKEKQLRQSVPICLNIENNTNLVNSNIISNNNNNNGDNLSNSNTSLTNSLMSYPQLYQQYQKSQLQTLGQLLIQQRRKNCMLEQKYQKIQLKIIKMKQKYTLLLDSWENWCKNSGKFMDILEKDQCGNYILEIFKNKQQAMIGFKCKYNIQDNEKIILNFLQHTIQNINNYTNSTQISSPQITNNHYLKINSNNSNSNNNTHLNTNNSQLSGKNRSHTQTSQLSNPQLQRVLQKIQVTYSSNTKLQKQLLQKQHKIHQLQTNVKQNVNKIVECQEKNGKLVQQLHENNLQIQYLNSQICSLNGINSYFKEKDVQMENIINMKEGTIQNIKKVLEENNLQYEKLEEQMSKCKQYAANKQLMIQEMREQLADRQEIIQEYKQNYGQLKKNYKSKDTLNSYLTLFVQSIIQDNVVPDQQRQTISQIL